MGTRVETSATVTTLLESQDGIDVVASVVRLAAVVETGRTTTSALATGSSKTVVAAGVLVYQF
jgi:hypothetical protein